MKAIGYWRSADDTRLPDPSNFIDESWDVDERESLAEYLDGGQEAIVFMGSSRCRICGIANGRRSLTDGEYIWPEGLGHYLVAHAVRLPVEFVDHVREQRTRFDEVDIDFHWWITARRDPNASDMDEPGTPH